VEKGVIPNILQNHILDFSKINHFEKTWQKTRRVGMQAGRRYDGTLALQQSEVPMMNLFAEVDIAVICEEVVESVFAGHVFQNITAQSFDMVPNAQRRMSDVRSFGIDAKTMAEHIKHAQVPVIFDVKMRNFHFTTQPGAFRRIIMNLLGNALKYTSHGYVHVTLETTEPEQAHNLESAPRSMVTLTVADTGKGICSEFLRSKLFTPFTQENSLSSGTGLGLAIVKSIVSLLEGEIAIDSEVGRGTSKLPLSSLRPL
jgi:signal transduction histidine kinase